MKNPKNALPILAFVFAIGAAFAFAPITNVTLGTKPAHAANNNCSVGTVDDACSSITDGQICKMQEINLAQFDAVPTTVTTNCVAANPWRNPDLQ